MFESDSSLLLEWYDDDNEKLVIRGLAMCNGLLDLDISEGVSTFQELGDWLWGGGVTTSIKLDLVDAKKVNMKPVLSVSKLFA
jgi:hypothetical protein